MIDLLPPNKHCPDGFHVAIQAALDASDAVEDVQPRDRPVAVLAYESRLPNVGAYLEFVHIGDALPEMPLFVARGRYVNLPIAATYNITYHALPKVTRKKLEDDDS